MPPAVISYRIVEDGLCWHWEVRRNGMPFASGTERSAAGARVQALLRGVGLAEQQATLSDQRKSAH